MSRTTYLNGLAAEDIAERLYVEKGYTLLEKRWRGKAGEVDLILSGPDLVVFVEVKARISHEAAAHAITPRQWSRIMASAELYMSEKELPPTTDLRFDAALIDRAGVCQILENAPIM